MIKGIDFSTIKNIIFVAPFNVNTQTNSVFCCYSLKLSEATLINKLLSKNSILKSHNSSISVHHTSAPDDSCKFYYSTVSHDYTHLVLEAVPCRVVRDMSHAWPQPIREPVVLKTNGECFFPLSLCIGCLNSSWMPPSDHHKKLVETKYNGKINYFAGELTNLPPINRKRKCTAFVTDAVTCPHCPCHERHTARRLSLVVWPNDQHHTYLL